MQTFDRITSYPYSTSVGKVCKAEWLNTILNIKWLTLITIQMKNKTEHNRKWLYIPDHPYRILIVGTSAPEK